MLNTAWKKALVLQSLFFCGLACGQNPRLLQPREGEPLQNPQPVHVSVPDGHVTRVEVYVNGKLQQARRRAPFQFEIHWNTELANRLKVLVRFTDRPTFELIREFRQIRADVETGVENTAMFPFLDQPLEAAQLGIRAGGEAVEPIRLESAAAFPLDLTVVLDVSGSMLPSLPALSQPLRALLNHLAGETNRLRLIAFDAEPRSVKTKALPADLSVLHRGQGDSIIWDAIATAVSQFDRTARKVVVLISDGAENGSSHTSATVADYLRQSGTALIWISPTGRQDRTLQSLVDQSGGFSFKTNDPAVWTSLRNRVAHQIYLLLPGERLDVTIRTARGDIWHPRWHR